MDDLEHGGSFIPASRLPGKHGHRAEIAESLTRRQVRDAIGQHADPHARPVGAEYRARGVGLVLRVTLRVLAAHIRESAFHLQRTLDRRERFGALDELAISCGPCRLGIEHRRRG
ncbi:MAG: hypothetical protein EWM73_03354 [Nitrospira sp.]|nr:MAG: hypothetical protein EWM73_03354 [Nitrospira sp.]